MTHDFDDDQTIKDRLASLDDDALESLLTATHFRQDCPEGMELTNYYFELLSDSDQAQVAAHLENCPHCQAELADLRRSLEMEWTESNGFQWGWKDAKRLVVQLLDPPSLTLAPLMRSASTRQADQEAKRIIRHIIIGPEEVDDVDLQAIVTQLDDEDDQEFCTLTVHVKILSHWLENAGIQVQVRAGYWQRAGATNASGKVIFTDLPLALVKELIINVTKS